MTVAEILTLADFAGRAFALLILASMVGAGVRAAVGFIKDR